MSTSVSLCFAHLECTDNSSFTITGYVELRAAERAYRLDVFNPRRLLADYEAVMTQLGPKCAITCPLPGNDLISDPLSYYVMHVTAMTGGETTVVSRGFKFLSSAPAGPLDIEKSLFITQVAV